MKVPYFSHIVDERPGMVDISHKIPTLRCARAQVSLQCPNDLIELLKAGKPLNNKGPVFDTAIIAGTMAAKNTAHLIPLCHNIPLSSIKFEINYEATAVVISCEVKTQNATGVEMEALTGASIAALTVYDMCKSISSLVISDLRLVKKTGGKNDLGS